VVKTPQPMPTLPSVAELKASPNPEARFSQWENDCRRVRVENDTLFHKDMRLIGLCAGIHGALNASIDHHFSWCPAPRWDAHWRAQGFSELQLDPMSL